ncbi:MAG: hypothetical protein HXX11_21020 [Desulfuromonadales bacterium]|nr:hypothetical protein [Desulfuromonadales bacterium]
MASFIWENKFNSGIESMDAQRKRIFECMTMIYRDIADFGNKCDSINGLLDQLEILCQIHYLDEEQLMDDLKYPLAADHKLQHDLFLATLDQFKVDNKQCHTVSTLNDFIKLRETFITHMLNDTMVLSEFIKQSPLYSSANTSH